MHEAKAAHRAGAKGGGELEQGCAPCGGQDGGKLEQGCAPHEGSRRRGNGPRLRTTRGPTCIPNSTIHDRHLALGAWHFCWDGIVGGNGHPNPNGSGSGSSVVVVLSSGSSSSGGSSSSSGGGSSSGNGNGNVLLMMQTFFFVCFVCLGRLAGVA